MVIKKMTSHYGRSTLKKYIFKKEKNEPKKDIIKVLPQEVGQHLGVDQL